jgi:hypothetical protein
LIPYTVIPCVNAGQTYMREGERKRGDIERGREKEGRHRTNICVKIPFRINPVKRDCSPSDTVPLDCAPTEK